MLPQGSAYCTAACSSNSLYMTPASKFQRPDHHLRNNLTSWCRLPVFITYTFLGPKYPQRSYSREVVCMGSALQVHPLHQWKPVLVTPSHFGGSGSSDLWLDRTTPIILKVPPARSHFIQVHYTGINTGDQVLKYLSLGRGTFHTLPQQANSWLYNYQSALLTSGTLTSWSIPSPGKRSTLRELTGSS